MASRSQARLAVPEAIGQLKLDIEAAERQGSVFSSDLIDRIASVAAAIEELGDALSDCEHWKGSIAALAKRAERIPVRGELLSPVVYR